MSSLTPDGVCGLSPDGVLASLFALSMSAFDLLVTKYLTLWTRNVSTIFVSPAVKEAIEQ